MPYEHIEQLMQANGETQKDLANLICRSQGVVSNIFRGVRDLEVKWVPLIAKHYKRSEGYIMHGREEDSREIINLKEIEERELGLVNSILAVILALVGRGVIKREDLETTFNHYFREIRGQKPNAALVLDQFLDCLHSKSFEAKMPSILQFQQLPRAQSKKEKN